MKIRKSLIMALMGLFLISFLITPDVLGAISSVTLNVPTANDYKSDQNFIGNVTVIWTKWTNITNVTMWFVCGTNATPYSNGTINGSSNATADGDNLVLEGGWTFNLTATNLSECSYSVIAEARNQSAASNVNSSKNSSARTFVIDRSNVSILLTNPNNYETIIPTDDMVTFYYTPTDTNLANITLYLNSVPDSKATSNTIGSNATSGVINVLRSKITTGGTKTWLLEGLDLAGNRRNSTSRKVIILLASASGEPIVTSGGITTGGLDALNDIVTTEASTFLQQNLVWIILGIIFIAVVAKKRKRRKG